MRDSPEAFAPPPMDLMDCFPAALLQLRDNGQIAHFNLAWAELMGPPGAERNLMDYVHQEDRPLWRQALNELRRRPDTSFNQRLRFVHPSGELRWFEISLKRGPQGFYLVAGDVTAHKRREIAWQASQRSSMSLLDSMPGLIYRGRNNRDWTMEFVSAGCLELTGYPAERLIDSQELTYNGLIHPHDREQVWRGVQEGLRARRPFVLQQAAVGLGRLGDVEANQKLVAMIERSAAVRIYDRPRASSSAIIRWEQKPLSARTKLTRTWAGRRANVSPRNVAAPLTQAVLPGRSQKCATCGTSASAATIGRWQGFRPLRV